MVITLARGHRGLAWLTRLVLLVLVADLLAHDAAYRSLGAAVGRTPPLTWHDYWPLFLAVVAVAGTSGLVRALRRLRSLECAFQGAATGATPFGGSGSPVHPPLPSYHRELLVLWPAVTVLTAVAFLVQENLEHLVATGAWFGLAPLDGRLQPDAVPLVVLSSLVAAAAGALVRWRVRTLEYRLELVATAFPRPAADRADRAWRLVAAASRRRRQLVRLDAGRAPPIRV